MWHLKFGMILSLSLGTAPLRPLQIHQNHENIIRLSSYILSSKEPPQQRTHGRKQVTRLRTNPGQAASQGLAPKANNTSTSKIPAVEGHLHVLLALYDFRGLW